MRQNKAIKVITLLITLPVFAACQKNPDRKIYDVNMQSETMYSQTTKVTSGSDLVTFLIVKPEYVDNYEISLEAPTVTVNKKDISSSCVYKAKTGLLVVPGNLIDGTVNIALEAVIPSYPVIIDEQSKGLKFYATDPSETSLPSAQKAMDYQFKMELDAPLLEYKLPDLLKIYVGSSKIPLYPGYYKVTKETGTVATVTIFGSQVFDYLTINASAVSHNQASVEFIKPEGMERMIDCTFDDHIEIGTSEFIATFSPTIYGYNPPNLEDITMLINGKQVNLPAIARYERGEDSKMVLTVQKEAITGPIIFTAKPHGTNILETLRWSEISEISRAGYAPLFFNVGDTKMFHIGSDRFDYEARIIGFNQDRILGEQKLGTTFEFTSPIRTLPFSDDDRMSVYYKVDREDNIFSYIYTYLNYLLPLDLPFASYLRSVKKITATSNINNPPVVPADIPSSNLLFPLSLKELGFTTPHECYEHEGDTYSYYVDAPSSKRLKSYHGQPEYINYWTRSTEFIFTEESILPTSSVEVINPNGLCESKNVAELEVYCAPAFCI
ncbi:MAG: hypothetical protein MJ206_03210 [Bacilli bacterium]|nr:hypothetical protein [Bacilli bacterium]